MGNVLLTGLGRSKLFSGLLFGMATLAGCSPWPRQEPENPGSAAEDPAARKLCSLKQEPDVVFITPLPPSVRRGFEERLREDLDTVKRINPIFLCGLDRIELRSDEDYAAVAVDPQGWASYAPETRSIKIRRYADWVLFHEIGHHVDVQELRTALVAGFRRISWASGGPGPEEKGPASFVSPRAGKDPLEDWADTFAFVATPTHRAGRLALIQSDSGGTRFYSDHFFEGLTRYLESNSDTAVKKKVGLLYREIPGLPSL